MKKFTLLLVIPVLFLTFCNAPVKAVTKAVESAAESAKDKAAESLEDKIAEENTEPIVVNAADVESFYKTMNDNHEGIDFMSPIIAAVQAQGKGLDLEKVFVDETGMTLEEYGRISKDIIFAESEYQGVIMSRDIYNQMENGYERSLDEMDKQELTAEQKKEYKAQLEKLKEELKQLEEKLESADVERIEANHKIIMEISEKCGF